MTLSVAGQIAARLHSLLRRAWRFPHGWIDEERGAEAMVHLARWKEFLTVMQRERSLTSGVGLTQEVKAVPAAVVRGALHEDESA
jgi:hypothetical protein